MTDALVAEAVELARALAVEARGHEDRSSRRRSRRMARLVADPAGLPMALALTDEVMRIRDHGRAARRFAEVVRGGVPPTLPPLDRAALRAGALLAEAVPSLVMPLVRRRVKAETAGLVLPAESRPLARHIRRRRREGVQLNVNLLGEAILGEDEARRRLEGVQRLLARDDVDYVSVKLSSVSSHISSLAFDDTVDELVERLRPLYEQPGFVNLDMEEYRDLWLTTAVFRRLVADFPDKDLGIVLQAYLPDSHAAMAELRAMGPRVKVRIVKGANLAMERVEAEQHGWPQAPYDDKRDVDASYKRLLDSALDGSVRIGVASHNLFDVAWALTVARHRGALDRIDVEMLEGMAPAQSEAVRGRAPSLRLYAPVVGKDDFDASIAYLARRLEENTQPGNFLREVFDLDPDGATWDEQEARFREAVARRHVVPTSPRRTQDRRLPAEAAPAVFRNEPDTDFALAANRSWIESHLRQPLPSRVGNGDDVAVSRTRSGIDPSTGEAFYEWHAASVDDVERALAIARRAGVSWGARTPRQRAELVRRVGDVLASMRGRLLAAMVRDAGKTVAEADPEVSEAIDFARYYAACADDLEGLLADGLRFEPYGVTVVVPPWNFPVAIPAGGVLAALVAGSAVVLKPAPETVLCGALVAEACWEAGIPRDVLQLLPCDDDDAGTALVTGADGVILTGSVETARLFHSWKPTMRLHAETSGKNALVVTAAADLDAAVKDVVRSAFGHAGQKCSAASLLICEASVHDDPRFLRQLADATRSLIVGPAGDLTTTMGPLIHPPEGALRRALTTLDPGESWLVEPRQLDEHGYLWTPGVRIGVRPGSWFHETECFGPVLGVLRAPDLDTAIDWQNATAFGLTAGIHSLDRAEVARWLDRVEAGNAYVNRSTVGAIVRRQPFGGWKKSAVGAGTKAGGPNYLLGLSDWSPEPATTTAPLDSATRGLLEAARHLDLADHQLAFLARSLGSDALAWQQEFGVARDVSALMAERNVLRYLPIPVTVRDDLGDPAALLRVVGAGVLAGAPVTVSTPAPLDPVLKDRLMAVGVTCRVDDVGGWRRLLRDEPPARVRLLGGSRAGFADASAGRADVALYAQPVVEAGRVELLTFLREQAVAVTAHRFGSPTALAENLFR